MSNLQKVTNTELLERAKAAAGKKAAAGPEVEEMKNLVREVPVPQPVKEYVTRLVLATRPDREGAPDMVRRFVRYGSSPRGAQALVGPVVIRGELRHDDPVV